MSAANPFAVVVADVQGAIARILAGLKWFAAEAGQAVAWVDRDIPGAQQTLAELFQAADAAAETLAGHAADGLGDLVSQEVDAAGTAILNLISRSGLDLTARAALSAADVATVSAAHSIAQSALSVALARALGAAASVKPAAAP